MLSSSVFKQPYTVGVLFTTDEEMDPVWNQMTKVTQGPDQWPPLMLDRSRLLERTLHSLIGCLPFHWWRSFHALLLSYLPCKWETLEEILPMHISSEINFEKFLFPKLKDW